MNSRRAREHRTRIGAETSDAELVRALKAGQQEALGILYDRYGGLVYTIALKILERHEEAEDLTQDIFLNFWQQDKFDPNRAALGTYLAILTRSRSINKLNSRSSQQRSIDRLQQTVEIPPPTPLEQVSQEEQQGAVRQALTQLNDSQRRILEMNYYQGLSHSHISQQLEMPLGTVKTNARQGLLKLRQLLQLAVG